MKIKELSRIVGRMLISTAVASVALVIVVIMGLAVLELLFQAGII